LLSYEEFTTILCRAEACVNSRPLSQLTSDPNDLRALTPGHFSKGRAITAPPDTSKGISAHKRWDLIKHTGQILVTLATRIPKQPGDKRKIEHSDAKSKN
jgi:hypothetical protein